jgi:hypothetical protein
MRQVLLFATTFLPVLVRGCFAECVADFHLSLIETHSLTVTHSLPQFVPLRDLQVLFLHDPTKSALGGIGRLQDCPIAEILAGRMRWVLGLDPELVLEMLANVQSRPVERETDYCLLHTVGEAKKQRFPQSALMQVWSEGLRVLESNLLHWLYLPLAK